MSSCTECGAHFPKGRSTCSTCHRPRWYTLKKISICMVIIIILALVTKYIVMTGDRTLSQWFG